MAKIEEPRPRAKRTGKERNAAPAETPQVEVSAEAMQGDAVVTEPEAGEPDGNEVLELPVLPLRGTVVFPLTVVPLAAAQPRSLRLIDEVMSGDRTVALVMQKDAELEARGPTT